MAGPATVSCGVLLLNGRGEVFACHATGTPRWDLPKGVADDAIDLRRCRCRSFFDHHRTGAPTPETDAWGWKPHAPATWCGKNMARVLGSLDWAVMAALPEVSRVEVDG